MPYYTESEQKAVAALIQKELNEWRKETRKAREQGEQIDPNTVEEIMEAYEELLNIAYFRLSPEQRIGIERDLE